MHVYESEYVALIRICAEMLESDEHGSHEGEQLCYELSLPVTEKCNPISRDIDRANGKQMVQILRRCDAEIFEKKINHNPFHQRLYSSPVIQTMVDVAKRVEMMLRVKESLIVLSGCGTSGRIAFLLVVWSLRKIYQLKKKKRKIKLETTAPFVAGQHDFCLKHLDVFTPVLLGFNAVHMARGISARITASFDTLMIYFFCKSFNSLQKKAHVYYIGWQTLGIIGLTDASECIPTYGAGAVQNDTVLFLLTVNGEQTRTSCTKYDDLHEVMALADQVNKDFKEFFIQQRQHWELSTKWCLNAISTGAHVLKGKVYVNYMIDLRVTNSKLYRRAHMAFFLRGRELICNGKPFVTSTTPTSTNLVEVFILTRLFILTICEVDGSINDFKGIFTLTKITH
uniref:Glucokinase (hexokinase 4) regulator n=1 Tax=Sinocyclocheilus grahami TaxID=75366 RepID=A0A672TE28_SINGR